MTRNQRISFALKESGKGQGDVGKLLGTTQAAISKRLSDEKEIDSLDFIDAVAKITGFNFDWLAYETGPEKGEAVMVNQVSEDTAVYLSGKKIRPLTVTMSPAGQELLVYVPVKAQAGYMKGYADTSFIEELPAFNVPGVKKNATYRMFEVDGDSMLQLAKGLRSGDIVIAKYVEDIFEMKDRRVYVVVTTEGVAIKRVINRLKDKEDPCLVMLSDNKNGQHKTYILKPKEVKEVWECTRLISADFSFDTNLFEILGDLQAEQERIKEKLKQLESR